jgi:hypothetical protein
MSIDTVPGAIQYAFDVPPPHLSSRIVLRLLRIFYDRLTISGISTFSRRVDLMTPASSAKLTRRGGEQPRFRTIASRVSESIGAEFFSMLVNELRQALDAECVYIGEFVGGKTERVETVAACVKEGRNKPA